MTFFLLVASFILSADVAAYTNSSPRQGHCRFLNSHSFDAGQSQSCLAATSSDDPGQLGLGLGLGLLTGIDVESAEYFSSELATKTTADVQWLWEPGVLWEAATKDANEQNVSTGDYLDRVSRALEDFQHSGEVHDREVFYQFLERVHKSKGNLLLVLGGKSVGKSLVLRDFAAKLDESTKMWPLLVDGRSFAGASLEVGILKAYKEFFQRELFGNKIPEQETLKLMKYVVQVFSPKASKDAARTLEALLARALAQTPDALTVKFEDADKENLSLASGAFIDDGAVALQSFVNLAKARGKRPVLIIDEANEVLGLGKGQGATSSVLSQMVRLTKELRELEVIMASSEYAYPYVLERNGLNLNNITAVLFAGEIPPKSMWELLVTKKGKNGSSNQPVIGMGENLAHLLIASYGGHVLWMSYALEALTTKKEVYTIDMGLRPIFYNVAKVLELFPHKGLVYLRQMAERGFAPVAEPEDKVVEMIVRSKIGGLITKQGSEVVGLPTSIWKQGDAGLVPISGSARNKIAIEVVKFEEERQWIITKRISEVVGLPTSIRKQQGVTGLTVPKSESARNVIAIDVAKFEEERRLEEEPRWWNRIQFWRRK
jgi:hypothetical protein